MTDQADSVLAIRVTDAILGVKLSDIKEILPMPSTGLMRAPTFPKCILGIINVRGRIAPVVNSALCLGEREIEDMRGAVICLCEQNNEMVGFIVDELLNTIESFEDYELIPDEEGKHRLCQVEFRMVDGVKTGLVRTADIYDAARQLAGKGQAV